MSANPQPETDRLEDATDQAIAACGGDVRAALRAMIVANESYRPASRRATRAALWPLGTVRIGMTRESPMTDVATDLKELFDGSFSGFLSEAK
jgi:hypothetical protein